ncbi:MAG: hypothetical protein JXA20_01325 [Spirochaetes bacterium]|nr:hypothetical protein [Spirochaetota bacterium]
MNGNGTPPETGMIAAIVLPGAAWLHRGPVIFWHTPLQGAPSDYGLPLWALYALWVLFLALLYPLCRRYAAVKFRPDAPSWMRYL